MNKQLPFFNKVDAKVVAAPTSEPILTMLHVVDSVKRRTAALAATEIDLVIIPTTQSSV